MSMMEQKLEEYKKTGIIDRTDVQIEEAKHQ